MVACLCLTELEDILREKDSYGEKRRDGVRCFGRTMATHNERNGSPGLGGSKKSGKKEREERILDIHGNDSSRGQLTNPVMGIVKILQGGGLGVTPNG